MRFWGVTGTNGKTTTTWIVAAFINAMAGRACGYVTTVEANTGSRQFYTGYTTPPLAQLKEIFAEMEANGCTDCVMEVSSHAIHQHRTGDTVFSGGVFTNLSEDHLDYHKTMEAYFDVKLDFARQIAEAHKATPDMGRANLPPYVVCLDGGYGREMFNAVGNLAVNVIGVSREANSTRGTAGTGGTGETDGTGSGRYDLSQLQLVGAYNESNVLCAAALAEAAGVSHEVIQSVIPTLKPRWGRLEYVPCVSKAKVYVDFAHTPDGLEKVLSAVRAEMSAQSNNQTIKQRPDQSNNQTIKQRPDQSNNQTIKQRPDQSNNQTIKQRLDQSNNQTIKQRPDQSNNQTIKQRPDQSNNQTIKQSNNSLWVVFGAGGDRDPMKRPLMGEACAKLADRLVVTSDNPRSEDPMKIIEAILGGIGEAKRSSTVVEPDRKKAIEFALREAAEGDVVIIAGKGHETTQEIAGVKYPFDDREVVRAWRV